MTTVSRDVAGLTAGLILIVLLLLEVAPSWALPVAWGGGLFGSLLYGWRWPPRYAVTYLLGSTAYFVIVGAVDGSTLSHIVGDVLLGWLLGGVPATLFAGVGAWLAPRLGL